MNPDRLNCPDRLNQKARVVGVARLNGWGIRFDLYSETNGCGVTDIARAVNEHVFGVLYDVPIRLVVAQAGRQSRMDRFEGARPDGTGNYQRIRLSVTADERQLTAVTYVGTDVGRQRFARKTAAEQQVSERYFGHLESGAQAFRFPREYKAYLTEQAGPLARNRS